MSSESIAISTDKRAVHILRGAKVVATLTLADAARLANDILRAVLALAVWPSPEMDD